MSDRKCPNCGAVCAEGADDSYACPQCGLGFRVLGGEAKLTKVGELDEFRQKIGKHDADIEELKKRLPASSPAAADLDEETEEPTESDDDDSEEWL